MDVVDDSLDVPPRGEDEVSRIMGSLSSLEEETSSECEEDEPVGSPVRATELVEMDEYLSSADPQPTTASRRWRPGVLARRNEGGKEPKTKRRRMRTKTGAAQEAACSDSSQC